MYFGGVEEEEEKLERECIALQKKKKGKKRAVTNSSSFHCLLVTLRKSGMHKIWVVKAEDYFRDAHNAGAERWR